MALIRTNRGTLIDTELIRIKQQLAAAVRPKPVIERKLIIDEKEGTKIEKQDLIELETLKEEE